MFCVIFLSPFLSSFQSTNTPPILNPSDLTGSFIMKKRSFIFIFFFVIPPIYYFWMMYVCVYMCVWGEMVKRRVRFLQTWSQQMSLSSKSCESSQGGEKLGESNISDRQQDPALPPKECWHVDYVPWHLPISLLLIVSVWVCYSQNPNVGESCA